MAISYLNGEFILNEDAKISVLDRGFLFGDGVYEVIPAYNARLFRVQDHLSRLQASLREIRLNFIVDIPSWELILEQLLAANGGGDQVVYIQISRGYSSVRSHLFPHPTTPPTLFACCNPLTLFYDPAKIKQGIAAITYADERWGNCHIKAINLLPNVLARQAAAEANAEEAILIRDGYAMEGSTSNLFIVKQDVIITPPTTANILSGITRKVVLEIIEEFNGVYQEQLFTFEEMQEADEIWLTNSTKTVVPVVSVDNKPIGQGKPGPVWQKVFAAFHQKITEFATVSYYK